MNQNLICSYTISGFSRNVNIMFDLNTNYITDKHNMLFVDISFRLQAGNRIPTAYSQFRFYLICFFHMFSF